MLEMINGIEDFYTHVFVILLIVASLIDRFYCQRGRVDILSAKDHGVAGGLIRFSLNYKARGVPLWSKVNYRLVNSQNPSTVIHGRAKPLEIRGKSERAEYLFLPASMLSTGKWELCVTVETVASRINGLYRLFPCVTKYSKQIEITCNEPVKHAPLSKQVQPHAELAPAEIKCGDLAGRRARVDVYISRTGAIFGRCGDLEPYVIGSWSVEDTDVHDIEFRVNNFFSMGSGIHERKCVGEATTHWKSFDEYNNDDVFLMSCHTDYIAFGWLNAVSTGVLEIKKKGIEGIACSSQLTITCG